MDSHSGVFCLPLFVAPGMSCTNDTEEPISRARQAPVPGGRPAEMRGSLTRGSEDLQHVTLRPSQRCELIAHSASMQQIGEVTHVDQDAPHEQSERTSIASSRHAFNHPKHRDSPGRTTRICSYPQGSKAHVSVLQDLTGCFR